MAMEAMVDIDNTSLKQAMEATNNHNNSMEAMDINNEDEAKIISIVKCVSTARIFHCYSMSPRLDTCYQL